MSGICAKQGIDYPANKRIIMAINGITNDSLIYVGQTIVLPVYS